MQRWTTLKKTLTLGSLGAIAFSMAAVAHHSFAVFFDDQRLVRIEGTVKNYRFANPHGSIVVGVRGASGEVHDWRIETNSPSILQRRGWNRTSLRPGDKVRVEGWLARDGSRYMRLRQVFQENGDRVGEGAFSQRED